jgi:hypothetical protein
MQIKMHIIVRMPSLKQINQSPQLMRTTIEILNNNSKKKIGILIVFHFKFSN